MSGRIRKVLVQDSGTSIPLAQLVKEIKHLGGVLAETLVCEFQIHAATGTAGNAFAASQTLNDTENGDTHAATGRAGIREACGGRVSRHAG
jgi:hypothetical protein